MLKTFLTELYNNEAQLLGALVAMGLLDVNSSPERQSAVLAEMHAGLEAAGVEKAPAPADGTEPVAAAKV